MPDTEERGQLEIFLGCAPGVGKTYEMLEQARTLRDDGVDVVIGVVETHGRTATAALIDGLEVVDRRAVEHRSTVLHEMDLEAILARRPAVVLVDELAHSNAPGLRNAKRWEDIDVLLAAGIDVLSTVNIQHLESLNDVVAQITGITQRETVPDDVVRAADQIELVDIEPRALRQRLEQGKVYAAGRIDDALANFFRQGNLTALRELALLWLADRVDDKLAAYRAANAITDTWEARERVVVAVTGGPESSALIRRASRIASRSSAELLVLHVVRGDGLADRGAADLTALRALATGVGAGVYSVVGDDVPQTLLEFARAMNATQLVLGTSRRSRWQRLFDEGVGAAVIRDSGRIDVHMVTHDRAAVRRRLDIRRTRFHRPGSWILAVLLPLALTGVLSVIDPLVGFSSQTALFFVVVLAVAMLGGMVPAALSAVTSGLLLNYFFAPPRFTFTIAEPDNVITLIVMLIIAIAVAALVDSATVRRRQAQRATRDAELLTLFSGAVLDGAGVSGLLERVRETYQQTAVAVARRDDRGATVAASVGEHPPASGAAADTVCPATGGEYELLLRGPAVGAADQRVLAAVASQVAAAVERDRLEAEAAVADELARTDELRRALLTAVSHDLRTPLAAAKAAASSLRSPDVVFNDEDTAELLATVEESVDQLSSLVGNLLDSSRLAAGVVRPELTRTYLAEVIHRAGAAAAHGGAAISVDLACDWARTDAGLLERALANLIDNGLRHGGGAVAVRTDLVPSDAPTGKACCRIRVIDHGPGIPADERARVFVPFHQYGDRDRQTSGVGLGLSVASGFVTAVGGTLTAEHTPGGGTTMTMLLPAGTEPVRGEDR
ncbi:sensor histidine kinase [Gordonia hydrophobica]|uniref:histidine kinase n=1 Tax=Gordonia hydrophobica TaxID=40516 RepID=A0ABZ2U6P4_9ACTN|nr:sensor histidine kinase KdpD [Gordonia hydrophobica]MBM7365326.1 two-component system sensor histidine kinase KdpD [Gordonia hydrophobica]